MIADFIAAYADDTAEPTGIELDSFDAIETAAAEAHAEAAAILMFPAQPAPADDFSFDSLEW